jgi:gluconate 5-dehydrogenase
MSVRKLFDLTGKIALVTGGSRGLGLQIAEALGEMGAKLALTARKAEELEEARAHLAGLSVEALTLPCDLSQPQAVAPMLSKVLERFGKVDILVNNAGATWGAPAEDHPLEAWQKLVNLNLTGTFLVTQAVGKRSMIPNRYGRIVNVASIAGLRGNPVGMLKTIAYNTTKGGVVNFTRALAAEWGEYGITVNAIAPGFVETELVQALPHYQKIKDKWLATAPATRLGTTQDIADAIVFLASERAGFINGEVLHVTGGRYGN